MTAISRRVTRPRRAAAAWLFAFVAGAAAFADRSGVAAERGAWRIDPARTHIGFVVDAVGFPRTQGEFHVFNGRLSIDFDRPAASRVTFTVRSDSIEVGSSSFDDTLARVELPRRAALPRHPLRIRRGSRSATSRPSS